MRVETRTLVGMCLVLAAIAAAPASAADIRNSLDDAGWAKAQQTWRPWTREEMMAAQPIDLGVTDEQLAKAAAEYDLSGGPGSEEGGLPDDLRARQAAGPALAGDDLLAEPDAGDLGKGYGYPAPYTRYQVFVPYTTFPFRTVGKVFFTKPGVGNFVCSASSIGGDGVLTAAHCVHDSDSNTYWTNWTFVPAYNNGAAPYGQWSANHLWVFNNWQNNNGGDFHWDLGGAVLNRRSGKKISQVVGWLGFQWNQPANSAWTLVGYPAAAPFNGKYQNVCHSSYAYGRGIGSPDPVGVGCDMTGGCSGGPWIRSFSGGTGSTNYANGVNSHRRCFDNACNRQYTQELFSPYFDANAKSLKDCIVNSVPGNPANPSKGCAPGT